MTSSRKRAEDMSCSLATTAVRCGSATVASLVVTALVLTGCGGGADGDGQYQISDSGWEYLVIDGDDVVHVEPSRDAFLDAIDSLDDGKVDTTAEYANKTGTLNDARDTVIWSHGDDDLIEIADDMVTLDDETYLEYHSEQAKAVSEKEIEDWHHYND